MITNTLKSHTSPKSLQQVVDTTKGILANKSQSVKAAELG